jgi:hypothetical protein
VGVHRGRRGKGRGEQRGDPVNIKAFFVDALTSALELRIATPDDVLKHVTPDVLSTHLPRPLWARLLTACLGAPRVDAQLVVDTIGVPNLCEHVPPAIIWNCITALAMRSLGKGVIAPPPEARASEPAPARPPVAAGPSIPPPAPSASLAAAQPMGPESLADVINEVEQTDAGEPRLATLRPRSPTAARFRQSNTSASRLGAARRPQASASGPVAASTSALGSSSRPRRGETEVGDNNDPDADETRVGGDNGSDWRTEAGTRDIPVDDSQLVDWQASENTPVGDNEDFSDLGRKR